MSEINSNYELDEENGNKSDSFSLNRDNRKNSGQFEKIDYSFNSGLNSHYSNNTESFKKYSESNGVESAERTKVRKDSYLSGFEVDSIINEDEWMKIGTMKSSGRYNTANSNHEMEQISMIQKQLKHDFSKRNLSKKNKQSSKKHQASDKQTCHSSKNSISKDYALQLIKKQNLKKKITKNYSSNAELKIPRKDSSLLQLKSDKKKIEAVDSYELLLNSYSEADSIKNVNPIQTKNGNSSKHEDSQTQHKRVDSLQMIKIVNWSSGCQLSRLYQDEEISEDHKLNSHSILDTPSPRENRKKDLKKSFTTVKAQ
jgi:hypothetical protein